MNRTNRLAAILHLTPTPLLALCLGGVLNRRALVLICLGGVLAADPITTQGAQQINWQTVAAQVTSNIVSKIAGAIAAKTNAVRALATPENYALLKSSKLSDAVKKLALQKQLAEAVLLDEEQTEAGRLKWHGHYTGQKIDMDALTATFTHADGTEYTVKFHRPNIKEEVAQIVKANARLPQPPMTNGVPKALAAARARRYKEKVDSMQTVTKEINATRGNRPTQQ